MRFPWYKLSADERVAAPILIRRLGVLRSLRVGRRIRRAERAGEPFAHLDPPATEQDRLSREQIGPAILLYRTLLEFVDRDEALSVCEEVVVEAAVIFLRESIGRLDRATIETLDEDAKQAFVKDRGEKFFNATVRWDQIDDEGVRFTVTACRFPPLCAECGVPELAPVFCKGDAKFFGTVEPDVTLTRTQTIAEGADVCPFALQWAERD